MNNTNLNKKDFGEIPILRATIAWNAGPPRGDGRIQIIPEPDDEDWLGKLNLQYSSGACWGESWTSLSRLNRLAALIAEAWDITTRYNIYPAIIHEAFMVIPEYRKMLPQLLHYKLQHS